MLLLILSINPFREAPPVLHFQFVLGDIVLSFLSLFALFFCFLKIGSILVVQIRTSVWLAMHGWSTIPEFYCLVCFLPLFKNFVYTAGKLFRFCWFFVSYLILFCQ